MALTGSDRADGRMVLRWTRLGSPAIDDQKMGGAIMWGTGEFPTVAMALIVLYRWRTEDIQHAKRRDARVDKYGDADLDELNEYYARMAASQEPTTYDNPR